MRARVIGLAAIMWCASFSVYAQKFYIKADDGKAYQTETEIRLKQMPESVFELQDWGFLKTIAHDPEALPAKGEQLEPREPTTIEDSLSVGVMLLTGLMILSVHDVYDLGAEFRLSRVHGLAFFFLSFDDRFLYQRCQDKEYLVATSAPPSEKTLERMKSLHELAAVCSKEEAQPLRFDPA